jgi:F-type H+-transporting ATPase subunit b
MQRGWLLLGLGVMLLALFAGAAWTQEHHEGGGDAKPPGTAPIKEATEHAEHEEESNIFKGWLDLGLWTIVVFLVLFFVLRKYAWGPMMEGLENREKHIRGELESAQKANTEAQTLRAEFERRINEAQQQVHAMIDEARKNGEQLKADMQNQAAAAIQAEKDRARRELQTEAEQERIKLFQQVTQLASLVSAKAVRRQMTIEDHHRLVDEALNDLGVAANERQRVLASIQ